MKNKVNLVYQCAIYFLSLSIFTLLGCSEEIPVPKPPTYPRLELPEQQYIQTQMDCPYDGELSSIYNYKKLQGNNPIFCAQEVDLGPLNGTLFLFYMGIQNKDSLASIINFANDKVDEHKIKADRIETENIIRKSDKVYGTFFALKGNVATNFQFYLTDSTKNFVRGEVLLNCRPNYDSLRPTLQYLKKDLKHFVETLKWKS